jgi:hypothetical protein
MLRKEKCLLMLDLDGIEHQKFQFLKNTTIKHQTCGVLGAAYSSLWSSYKTNQIKKEMSL